MNNQSRFALIKKENIMKRIFNIFLTSALICVALLCAALVLTSCDDGGGFEFDESLYDFDGTIGYYVSGRGSVTDTEIVIPETYRGKPILGISGQAFEGCTDITSVSIPDSVVEIEYNAFKGCTSLKSVKMSASVQYIGDEAFKDCTSLTDITLPDGVIGRLSYWAFDNCAAVEEEKGVTYLGAYALRIEKGVSGAEIREGTKYLSTEIIVSAASGPLEPSPVSALSLPSTLEYIDLYGLNDIHFFFNGTKDRWRSILNSDFSIATCSCVVTCNDGELIYKFREPLP